MIVRSLGVTDYETTWRAMQRFTDARDRDSEDELWLTEHPPIYTLGLAGRREHVLRDNGIPLVKVDRGGQVTYHGPGQLVAYTLVDLRRTRLAIRDMVRRLEGAVIEWLATHGVDAHGKVDAPGVYVGEAKVAALGIRVRRGCSFHGLAFNIAMNLEPFERINPCGYAGLQVTSMLELCGESADSGIEAVKPRLLLHLSEQFGLSLQSKAGLPGLSIAA
jgi:lipoyl(octanoyl) transferase